MPRPREADYLQPDETVLLQQRRHPLSVVDDVLGLLVGAAILLWLTWWGLGFWAEAPPLLFPVFAGIVVALVGAACVARWWRAMTSLYTVTEARVYETYGRLRWILMQTTFDKITDLHVRQGLVGRRFGFGSVRLMTAGTGLHLHGVRDPWALKQRVEDARTRFLDHLVSEGATPSVEPERPRSRGMGERVWHAAPEPAAFVGPLASGSLMLAVGILAATGAALWGSGTSWPLGALLGVAGAIGLIRAVIALRFTEYHVHRGGVVVTAGWLTRRRVEATYSKVTDVQTTQGVLGRMFGFGEIRVNTAGSEQAPIVFLGVAEPEQVKALIDDVRGAS